MNLLNRQIWATLIAAFAASFIVSSAQAGPFDNVLERMEDTVNKRTADMGEDAVDGVF